jgi:hypothetical protein
VQTHVLDQCPDLRLGAAQVDGASPHPQPPSEHREVEHQRSVGETELAEINDHVGLGTDGARQRLAPRALRRSVLVAAAAQNAVPVIEIDDRGKLAKAADRRRRDR